MYVLFAYLLNKVDLFWHSLQRKRNRNLRWSFAKIEPMEEKTKSKIGIVIIIVGLIAYNSKLKSTPEGGHSKAFGWFEAVWCPKIEEL